MIAQVSHLGCMDNSNAENLTEDPQNLEIIVSFHARAAMWANTQYPLNVILLSICL